MKTKPKYILEIRKRSTPAFFPNSIDHVIGIFSKPSLAVKWIKDEGLLFYGKRSKKPKTRFFALVEIKVVNDLDGSLHSFYDFDGKIIY